VGISALGARGLQKCRLAGGGNSEACTNAENKP